MEEQFPKEASVPRLEQWKRVKGKYEVLIKLRPFLFYASISFIAKSLLPSLFSYTCIRITDP